MHSTAIHLNVIVVGAGIAGLSTAICLARQGHKVTVLERSAHPSEYGAGIQLGPNATRLLATWGLIEDIQKKAFVPARSIIRRYANGEVLSISPQNPYATVTYGYPYWQIYRPDCQKILVQGALKAGVSIQYGVEVLKIDGELGHILLRDDRWQAADLVVIADGIHSKTRECVTGSQNSKPVSLGEYNYRAMIPAELMMQDGDTAALLQGEETHIWLGPDRFAVGYSISNGSLFNLAMVQPRGEDTLGSLWNEAGDVEELKTAFEDFSPLFQKLLGYIKSCGKWRIAEMPELSTWSSISGKTVLVGDAAHAMSPHAAQGGAMALEDAAALGEALAGLKSVEGLPQVIKAYEEFRKPRVARVSTIAKSNGKLWRLPDGEEQQNRDRALKDAMEAYLHSSGSKSEGAVDERGNGFGPSADIPRPQSAVLTWLYGYNVFDEFATFSQGSQSLS